jgi:eukaryotic-like serine/threonine-protein kinase
VLSKALAKDPAQRYASAREMADAVRIAQRRGAQPSTLTEGETMAQPRPLAATDAAALPTLLETPAPPVRRRWLIPVVGGGLASAAIVGTLAWNGRTPDPPSPLPPTPTTTTASAAPTPTLITTPPPQPTEPPSATLSRSPRPTPRASASRAPELRPSAAPPPASVAPEPKPAPPTTLPEPRPAPTADDRTGLLQIAVRPWANVSVDGRELGQTPLDRVALRVGSHVVRLDNGMYEVVTLPVTIRPGETSKVTFDFTKDGTRR